MEWSGQSKHVFYCITCQLFNITQFYFKAQHTVTLKSIHFPTLFYILKHRKLNLKLKITLFLIDGKKND